MARVEIRTRRRAAGEWSGRTRPTAGPRMAGLSAALALVGTVVGAQPVEPTPAAPIAYVIEDGLTIPEPLTTRAGDPRRGAALVTNAKGGCAECHSFSPGAGDPDARPLHDVGNRLSQGALRLWVVNPAALAPETEMPAYFSLYPTRDAEEPRRTPILTPQEIEDVVSYLNTLGARAAPAEPLR